MRTNFKLSEDQNTLISDDGSLYTAVEVDFASSCDGCHFYTTTGCGITSLVTCTTSSRHDQRSIIWVVSVTDTDPKPIEKVRYLHHEIIISWLSGATIQIKDMFGDYWTDLPSVYTADHIPSFNVNYEHRIKPL